MNRSSPPRSGLTRELMRCASHAVAHPPAAPIRVPASGPGHRPRVRLACRIVSLLVLLVTVVDAMDFVRRDGDRLTLGSSTWHAPGANCYYLIYKPQAMVDDVLEDAAAMGLRVVRTWGFLDRGSLDRTVPDIHGTGHKDGVYFQYWDPVTGAPAYNDGADGLQRLDYVVAKAGQLGLRLVIALTNNWQDFGGMDQYGIWYGLDYHDQFFSDARPRAAFKAWMAHLVNRVNSITGIAYRDDPTIMAWELANEPRCLGSIGGMGDRPTGSGSWNNATITTWAAEMSTHLKSIDPNHLVAVGDEGFALESGRSGWPYSVHQGVDHKALIALPDVDLASAHLYPELWFMSASWGGQWIADQTRWAREARKPLLLGEYGLKNLATRDAVYRDWNVEARTGGADGALVWMLAGYDPAATDERYPDYDGFTFHHPSSVSTALADEAASWRALDDHPLPLVVDAGAAMAITLPTMATLTGSATVDGVPASGALTYLWTKVTGPGTVIFSAESALTTRASFSSAGIYVLQLAVNDGALTGTDQVQVVVSAAVNVAPVVDAGADQAITLPALAALTGSVIDDGLPSGATLTYQWTKVSGPGTVTFLTASAPATTAAFSSAGTYVLELATSDGALTAIDHVQVLTTAASLGGDPLTSANDGGGCGLGSSLAGLGFLAVLLLSPRRP